MLKDIEDSIDILNYLCDTIFRKNIKINISFNSIQQENFTRLKLVE